VDILPEGVVDKYSEEKGFGYINGNDGRILTVRRSSIEMDGYKTLVPGDQVTFVIKETPQDLKALRVKKLYGSWP
jgi:CspA family cold shock protein